MKAKTLIFVVDDEPTARALMSKWIQKFGYEVRAFSGGEKCLEAMVTSDSERLEISTLPSEIADGSPSSGNDCFPMEIKNS